MKINVIKFCYKIFYSKFHLAFDAFYIHFLISERA